MHGRALWITLLVGILCMNAAPSQDKTTKAGAGAKPVKHAKKIPPPPAPQTTGSAKELKELTGKVKALEDAVNKLNDPQRLETLKRLDSDVQRLANGQSRASWIFWVTIILILVSAVCLWRGARRLANVPTREEVQAAIGALPNLQQITGAINGATGTLATLPQITGAINAAAGTLPTLPQITATVYAAAGTLPTLPQITATVNAAAGAQPTLPQISNAVNAATGTLPTRQELTAAIGAIQAALLELKAALNVISSKAP